MLINQVGKGGGDPQLQQQRNEVNLSVFVLTNHPCHFYHWYPGLLCLQLRRSFERVECI